MFVDEADFFSHKINFYDVKKKKVILSFPDKNECGRLRVCVFNNNVCVFFQFRSYKFLRFVLHYFFLLQIFLLGFAVSDNTTFETSSDVTNSRNSLSIESTNQVMI